MDPSIPETDPHGRAARLIPWYVNGTLGAAEAAELRAHLEVCAECRRDHDGQLRLRAAMRAEDPLVFAAEPSFRKLMARIDAMEDAAPDRPGEDAAVLPAPLPERGGEDAAGPVAARAGGGGTRWNARRPAAVRWLTAAVIVEGLVLGLAAWTRYAPRPPAPPVYATLTSAAPSLSAAPRVRVVFRAGVTMRELGQILRQAGARIVDGPDDANVYTLGFIEATTPPAVLALRVAALRADADVVFAEPGTAAPP